MLIPINRAKREVVNNQKVITGKDRSDITKDNQ